MAAPRTLEQMRTSAIQRADMAGASATGFVSTSEANARLNAALKRLYNKLLAARGADLYAVRATIAVVGGQEVYPLPADFMRLVALQLQVGDRYRDLAEYQAREESRLRSPGAARGALYARFRLQGQSLHLLPVPQEAATAVVIYVPAFTELVADTDTFDGVNGFEEWAELTAAIYFADKAEDGISGGLRAERDLVEADILSLSEGRSGQPAKVQDVRRDGRTLTNTRGYDL